jgi:hypothetical protein
MLLQVQHCRRSCQHLATLLRSLSSSSSSLGCCQTVLPLAEEGSAAASTSASAHQRNSQPNSQSSIQNSPGSASTGQTSSTHQEVLRRLLALQADSTGLTQANRSSSSSSSGHLLQALLAASALLRQQQPGPQAAQREQLQPLLLPLALSPLQLAASAVLPGAASILRGRVGSRKQQQAAGVGAARRVPSCFLLLRAAVTTAAGKLLGMAVAVDSTNRSTAVRLTWDPQQQQQQQQGVPLAVLQLL